MSKKINWSKKIQFNKLNRQKKILFISVSAFILVGLFFIITSFADANNSFYANNGSLIADSNAKTYTEGAGTKNGFTVLDVQPWGSVKTSTPVDVTDTLNAKICIKSAQINDEVYFAETRDHSSTGSFQGIIYAHGTGSLSNYVESCSGEFKSASMHDAMKLRLKEHCITLTASSSCGPQKWSSPFRISSLNIYIVSKTIVK